MPPGSAPCSHDRASELCGRLAANVAALIAQAEAADTADRDPQTLPGELARREALKARLDVACARLEAGACAQAEAERPACDARKAIHDGRTARRGRLPTPPDEAPRPERQSSLTDPESALMRRSGAHEHRQTYNAQDVVCANGVQLILATNLVTISADAQSFTAAILGRWATLGLPRTVLIDTGYASGKAVAELQTRGIEPLVATGRTQMQRRYDFRPPRPSETPLRITEPWRLMMKTRLEQDDAKALYKRRK